MCLYDFSILAGINRVLHMCWSALVCIVRLVRTVNVPHCIYREVPSARLDLKRMNRYGICTFDLVFHTMSC